MALGGEHIDDERVTYEHVEVADAADDALVAGEGVGADDASGEDSPCDRALKEKSDAADDAPDDGLVGDDALNKDADAAEEAPRMFYENVVTPAVHKSMQGNKRSDTKPEMLMRRELRAAGYPGYRLQWKKVPGHPDIAYPGRKIAIFINGCFWHHHDGCKYATTPKSNLEYWSNKFATNKARDQRNRQQLEDMGWKVIVVWECELRKDKLADTMSYVVQQISDTQ